MSVFGGMTTIGGAAATGWTTVKITTANFSNGAYTLSIPHARYLLVMDEASCSFSGGEASSMESATWGLIGIVQNGKFTGREDAYVESSYSAECVPSLNFDVTSIELMYNGTNREVDMDFTTTGIKFTLKSYVSSFSTTLAYIKI